MVGDAVVWPAGEVELSDLPDFVNASLQSVVGHRSGGEQRKGTDKPGHKTSASERRAGEEGLGHEVVYRRERGGGVWGMC